MSSYLQDYGAGDERRHRIIWRSIGAVIVVLVLILLAYLLLKNYREKQTAKHFLASVNAHNYQEAYKEWGCTEAHPCRNYSYQKFLEDWGATSGGDWKITGVDGCPTGAIITVGSSASSPQALWIERNTEALSFSPWPECPGRLWRFRQFFQRILGG